MTNVTGKNTQHRNPNTYTHMTKGKAGAEKRSNR